MLNNKQPAGGKLLISEPFMFDPNFKRSVVYLTEHNEEGSVGFVLNQKTELLICDIIEDLEDCHFPVYIGGPVGNDSLHYLHALGDSIEGSVHIMDGIYWGGNFEVMKILLENNKLRDDEVKFFIGYSGWGEGQLIGELNENAWLVADANAALVFGELDKKLWSEAIKSLGSKYAPLVNFPENPRLN